MSLLVQEFLLNKTFKQLQDEHGVYASFSKSGHKFSLNYDMIETLETDLLAQDCRGLVLSAEDGSSFKDKALEVNGKISYLEICPGKTKVLAFPLRRFFNHGQGVSSIDWEDKNLAIMEKLDGTLIIVYFDEFTNNWCVATRAVCEADLLMDNGIFTFRTLFEKALKETCSKSFDDYTNGLNKNITYCFELTTPYNRIVCDYKDSRVTLLAARNNTTFKEFILSDLWSKKWQSKDDCLNSYFVPDKDKEYIKTLDDDKSCLIDAPYHLNGVPFVRTYTYTSVNELINLVGSFNPMEHEGVVVIDSNFNRIKLKNPAYVAFNRARDVLGSSERNCVEIILQEKDDDVLPYLPEEIANNLKKIKINVNKLIHDFNNKYFEIKKKADEISLNDKKEFAILITKEVSWTAPFFQIFSGKAENMHDFILKNKKEGTWSNSFLDKILEISKRYDI